MTEEIVKKISLTPAKTAKEKTNSDLIWESVRNINLNLFALPMQTVGTYLEPAVVEPTKLYLKLKPHKLAATSIIAALEQALSSKYEIEVANNYYIISEK